MERDAASNKLLAPPGLDGLAGSAHPCFAWAADGQLVFANEAAAAYFGLQNISELAAIDWANHKVFPSLRRLLRSLGPGISRLERLALTPRGYMKPLTARVSRLASADGKRLIAVIGTEPVAHKLLIAVKPHDGGLLSSAYRDGGAVTATAAPFMGDGTSPAGNEARHASAAMTAPEPPLQPAMISSASAERGEATGDAETAQQAILPTPPAANAPASEANASDSSGMLAGTHDMPRRGEVGLRFVWETDRRDILVYLSRDLVAVLGASALPHEDETLPAFARRIGMTGHENLAAAMTRPEPWSGLRLTWPLGAGRDVIDVEMSAAPADGGGFRGFGVITGIVAGTTGTLASEADTPDAPAEAAGSAEKDADRNKNDSVASNVVHFPVPAAQPAGEHRLDPAESAALRTIARVLGGPIGLPRASANDLKSFMPLPAGEPVTPEGKATQKPSSDQASPPAAETPAAASSPAATDIAPAGTSREARFGDQQTSQLLREARLREAELRAILDTATDGIVILSGQGRILSLNRSAEALFGYDSSDVLDEPFTRLLAPASHRVALDYLDGLARNGVASVLNDGRDVAGLERKGGIIPLFMTIGRVSLSGDDDKFCAVLRDITQWKTAEESLVAAKREAEEASHHKSDFLAKISHEIRTPLNAIIGFAEVMKEERFGALGNERYRTYVEDIHAAGEHILGLVNDLLDLAKIEAGKIDLNFAAVRLGDIVQQAVSTMQTEANRQGVILRSSLPKVPPVVADLRSLRQILFNLVSNAIKFSRAGGQVIVSIGLTDEGEVTIKVRDSGLGMSSDDIETALKPFGRISTAGQAATEGTGLGLPLTKALAEANRAAFHIDSTPGIGTLVQITFPSTRVLAE